jgi:CRISPR system Cascade subunit CasC
MMMKMETNNRLFVDVHVLQTVPPSCVNRDDTGSPKTAVYGGVTRARVSSQSWKHSMRLSFKETMPKDNLAVRTKRIVGLISAEMKKLGDMGDSDAAAQKILEIAGLKIKSAEVGTDALFFMSYTQAKELAKLAMEVPETISDKPSKEAKNKVVDALKQLPGIEVALFGRMVADDPSLNTDACAQVAHSISTHKVSNEYDYFTAVDDLAPEDNAGAAHIGTTEFNSSTLYRYATVAVHELYKQLKDDAISALCEFIRAFVYSMPTGKQNTFANRTLPYAVLVTLRTNQPVNLVGAFERPVPPGDNGYETASAERLVAHVKNVYQDFAGEPARSLVTGSLLAELGEVMSFSDLLNEIDIELHKQLQDNGDEL